MKVILTQAVPNLGEAGTIKEVADGYARNFLIPKKMAMPATHGSLKQAEAQAETIARRANKVREETQRLASALDGKSVTIRARVGSEGRLYGSVTSPDVADAVKRELGIEVDRRRITLSEAIHRTGTYQATADMGNGIAATFSVEVAPDVAGASGKAQPAVDSPVVAQGDETVGDPGGNAAPVAEVVAEQEAEASPS
ncbi:MAG: 50S ribosomal protein L9 [Chloroflexota bacterium]|nr:50S ribosomal protein L9 [Chloroflexota bacterium]